MIFWFLDSMKPLQILNDHSDRIWSLAWNPKGTLLASCSTDKTIRIWSSSGSDDQQFKCGSILQDAHSRTIRSVSFSHCGRYLVSASFDSTIVVWELKDGDFEILSTLEGHENEVKSAVFSPSGRYLASCSRDKSVWVWE
uniref:Uncharacterized protein n=1 Tax=Romanomermis culicivorax TaxID=13658 RepID=A0A915J0T7_ROMCU